MRYKYRSGKFKVPCFKSISFVVQRSDIENLHFIQIFSSNNCQSILAIIRK